MGYNHFVNRGKGRILQWKVQAEMTHSTVFKINPVIFITRSYLLGDPIFISVCWMCVNNMKPVLDLWFMVVLHHVCTNMAYKSLLKTSNKTLKQWNIPIHNVSWKHYTETPYYVTCHLVFVYILTVGMLKKPLSITIQLSKQIWYEKI